MPKSKNRKKHETKLKQYKQTKMEQQNQMEIPEVRSVPIWTNETQITITGLEFDAIFNNLMQIQTAQQAVNGIMSRNILNGTIQMDFERFDKSVNNYVPMTEEEKIPYRADFAKAVEAAKRPKSDIVQVERPSLVTPEGVAVKAADLVKPTRKPRTPKAKVVQGDFAKPTAEPLA